MPRARVTMIAAVVRLISASASPCPLPSPPHPPLPPSGGEDKGEGERAGRGGSGHALPEVGRERLRYDDDSQDDQQDQPHPAPLEAEDRRVEHEANPAGPDDAEHGGLPDVDVPAIDADAGEDGG